MQSFGVLGDLSLGFHGVFQRAHASRAKHGQALQRGNILQAHALAAKFPVEEQQAPAIGQAVMEQAGQASEDYELLSKTLERGDKIL